MLRGIAARVCVGLGAACSALDDDAAAGMRALIERVDRALGLVDERDLRDRWHGALAGLADQRGVHGEAAGRAVRILLDAGRLAADDVERRLSRALSTGAEAAASAAWLEGFLSGEATVLLHDEGLLAVIDAWVSDVAPDAFDDLLPVLRRTFGGFTAAERRKIGRRVRQLDGGGSAVGGDGPAVDEERAARAVPVLRAILGVDG